MAPEAVVERALNQHDLPPTATPLLATFAIPAGGRFPVSDWAIRTGRTTQYIRFRRDVKYLLSAFGLTEHDLHDATPPFDSDTNANIKEEGNTVTRSVAAAAAKQREHWIRVNTALFWHVRPAIVLTGPDADRDQRHIDTMVMGHLARGRALILWALSFADDSSLGDQTKLTLDVGAARLKTDATWTEFNLYVQGLHEKWARIKANMHAASLLGFYQQLLVGIPTEPASAHLTTLRTFLATWVATLERLESGEPMPKGAPRLHNLDLALDDLHTQSTIIGMRQGAQDSKVTRGIVAALGGQTDALCLQCDDLDSLPDGDGMVHVLANSERKAKKHRDKPHSNPPSDTNDCGFCDARLCQSAKHGGVENCVCRSQSKFDVDKKGTKGQARYCTLLRAYHRAHPNASTLKNVKLRVAPAEEGAKPRAGVHYLTVEELRGDSDATEFDQWLEEYECLAPGIWGIGDFAGLLSITDAEEPHAETEGDRVATSVDKVLDLTEDQSAGTVNADMLAIQAELAAMRTETANMRSALATARAELEKRGSHATPTSAALVPTPATAALPPDLVPTSPALLALAERDQSGRGLHLLTPAPSSPGDDIRGSVAKSGTPKAASTKLTVTEHLASAMLLNEQQQRILKASRALTFKGALGKVATIAATMVTLGARVTVKHWAIMATALQCLVPHMQPRLRELLLRVLSAMTSLAQTASAHLVTRGTALLKLLAQRVSSSVAPKLLRQAREAAPAPVASAITAAMENVSGVFMLHGVTGQGCGAGNEMLAESSEPRHGDFDASLFTVRAANILSYARSVATVTPFNGNALRAAIQELPESMGICAKSGGKISTWGALQAAVAIPLLHPNAHSRRRNAHGSFATSDLKELIQQHGASKQGYYLWRKRLTALDAWVARRAADAAMVDVALAEAALQALVEDDMGSMGVHTHALVRTTGDANAPVQLVLIAANMVDDLADGLT